MADDQRNFDFHHWCSKLQFELVTRMSHEYMWRECPTSEMKVLPIGTGLFEGASEGKQRAGMLPPKLAKLDFWKYDGSEDPVASICRAEQFFDF